MNFSPIVDFFGKSGTAAAIILNIKSWLFSETGTLYLTVFISILVIVFWIIKIYCQIMVAKKLKNENK